MHGKINIPQGCIKTSVLYLDKKTINGKNGYADGRLERGRHKWKARNGDQKYGMSKRESQTWETRNRKPGIGRQMVGYREEDRNGKPVKRSQK